ncbi:hypothetical protein [Lederbergia citrea]|uniref:hypothetical protein n=1 Tax=Lederbergia citrea TaxID=2833581 RepID=UPI001BC9C303|nr:hypothetical protein [Lederbergia citrea]MBS4203664.1 hypothetical protein [Lederbergia citrea]
MVKRILFPFGAVLVILLVVAGCGKPEEGMNELSLKQLEMKLDNHETFLLLTFAADENAVSKTDYIKAYDDSLKRGGLTGYYFNFEGESKEAVDEFGKKYTHPKSKGWNPITDGLGIVDKGGVIDEYGTHQAEGLIEQRAKDNDSFLDKDEMKDIDSGVKEMLEYIQVNNVELTD